MACRSNKTQGLILSTRSKTTLRSKATFSDQWIPLPPSLPPNLTLHHHHFPLHPTPSPASDLPTHICCNICCVRAQQHCHRQLLCSPLEAARSPHRRRQSQHRLGRRGQRVADRRLAGSVRVGSFGDGRLSGAVTRERILGRLRHDAGVGAERGRTEQSVRRTTVVDAGKPAEDELEAFAEPGDRSQTASDCMHHAIFYHFYFI